MIRCEKCPEVGPCEYENICMCGSYKDGHGMWDGHSFVSMHDYYGHHSSEYLAETIGKTECTVVTSEPSEPSG